MDSRALIGDQMKEKKRGLARKAEIKFSLLNLKIFSGLFGDWNQVGYSIWFDNWKMRKNPLQPWKVIYLFW